MNAPDPLMHFKFSMAKSVVRIAAGVAGLAAGIHIDSVALLVFAGGLIIAEVIGIFEEIV